MLSRHPTRKSSKVSGDITPKSSVRKSNNTSFLLDKSRNQSAIEGYNPLFEGDGADSQDEDEIDE